MLRLNKTWRYIPLGLAIVLGGFFWRGLALNPQLLPSTQLKHALPWFRLPALAVNMPDLTTNDLHGKISLLTVWASWCEACQDEQPLLLQLAHHAGVTLYGINYKDNADDARHWLVRFGNPYASIGQDVRGRVAIDLGVYGVPETFLVDADGIIRYRHAGALTPRVWEQVFLPKINALVAST